jgi:mono/diheme cytochrome c family protein
MEQILRHHASRLISWMKERRMQRRWWGAVALPLLAVTIGLSASTSVQGAAAKKAPAKAAKPSPAVVAQGKKFVASDGCLACHKIGKNGGATGPELTKIGKEHKATEIASVIKNPKKHNPKTLMPASQRPDKEINAMAAYLSTLK